MPKPKQYTSIPHLLKIYSFISSYKESQQGDSPSMRDLCDARLASGPGMVRYYYQRMAELGMIRFTPFRPRSIHLMPMEQWDSSARAEFENKKKEKHE